MRVRVKVRVRVRVRVKARARAEGTSARQHVADLLGGAAATKRAGELEHTALKARGAVER